MRCVILKHMKHALKALKDNEHFSGKNMRKNKDENIDIQRFTAKER